MTCAATLVRSDLKERGDERFFAVIGFSHTEHMAIRATRCVTNDDHAIPEHAIANDSSFAIVLTRVFRLKVGRFEDKTRVLKVQLSLSKRLGTLDGIVGNGHGYCRYINHQEQDHLAVSMKMSAAMTCI
jgi:hypothetical protein